MLYHLFKYFDNVHNLPGAGMFQYISFRAAAAIIIALLIVIVFGRNIINFLRRKQIGEEIRDLGLEGQLQKKGTPTMGGVIILLAILIPVLLFGQLDNVYIPVSYTHLASPKRRSKSLRARPSLPPRKSSSATRVRARPNCEPLPKSYANNRFRPT